MDRTMVSPLQRASILKARGQAERSLKRYESLFAKARQALKQPVIVNTSFNVRDEPIACTPEDAYRCFMKTEMDILVLQSHLLVKGEA